MFAFREIKCHFDYLRHVFRVLQDFINYICVNFISYLFMDVIKGNFKKTFDSLKSIYKKYHFSRIAFTGILIFILFIDNYSLIHNLRYIYQIQALEREISYYQNLIDESKDKLIELNSNHDNLEKFAREQFLMKKANEDIFIIKSND